MGFGIGGAPPATAPLPSLTAPVASGGATAPSDAGVVTPPTAASNPLATGRWAGPVMAAAGGVAMLVSHGRAGAGGALLRFGGLGGVVAGTGLTAAGFGAAGLERGRIEGSQAAQQQATMALATLQADFDAQIVQVEADAQAEAQVMLDEAIAASGGGMMAPAETATAPVGALPAPVDPTAIDPAATPAPATVPATGAATAVIPTSDAAAIGAAPTATGGTGVVDPAAAALDPAAAAAEATGIPAEVAAAVDAPATEGLGPAAVLAPDQWTPGALIGSSVELEGAGTAAGTAIADEGQFVLTTQLGAPEGYASVEEADTVARLEMSIEEMGVRDFRWVVVEHAGRSYPFVAKADATRMSPPMPTENGELAAWSALRFIEELPGGESTWQAYSWSASGGETFGAFASPEAWAAQAGVTGSPGSTGTSETSSVATDPPSVATSGGGTTGAAWSPTSVIGSGFTIDAATTGTLQAAGGVLQLQALVPGSEAGFATAEEATAAARSARSEGTAGPESTAGAASAGADPWQRWVTMQGPDGHWYAYAGGIVSGQVPEPAGVQPLTVFGHGFGQYHDGTVWQVQADG